MAILIVNKVILQLKFVYIRKILNEIGLISFPLLGEDW